MTDFLFIGGRSALDLCNTVDEHGDHLDSPQALARWLQAAGLTTPCAPPTHDDLDRVIRLRGALRAAFVSHDAVRVTTLTDEWLGDSTWRLSVDRERMTVSFRPESADCHCAVAPLLLDALDLARDGIQLVRECASERCTLIYEDVSRNHSRRWCSMDRCGSRAKAHTYYERHKRRG